MGDVAGGVAVVPADGAAANMRDAIISNMMFFLAVVAAMALLIYVVISRLITEPLTGFGFFLPRSRARCARDRGNDHPGLWASSRRCE
ncbi:MAG: hypothetical protein ACLTEX_00785 [Eggerthella lenta]